MYHHYVNVQNYMVTKVLTQQQQKNVKNFGIYSFLNCKLKTWNIVHICISQNVILPDFNFVHFVAANIEHNTYFMTTPLIHHCAVINNTNHHISIHIANTYMCVKSYEIQVFLYRPISQTCFFDRLCTLLKLILGSPKSVSPIET